jgi:hypothetical protein
MIIYSLVPGSAVRGSFLLITTQKMIQFTLYGKCFSLKLKAMRANMGLQAKTGTRVNGKVKYFL